MINILYFARLREQLDQASDSIEYAVDVAAVMEQLRCRGGVWEEVFDGSEQILMSVNQEMAGPETALKEGDEVAFFPPVTGG